MGGSVEESEAGIAGAGGDFRRKREKGLMSEVYVCKEAVYKSTNLLIYLSADLLIYFLLASRQIRCKIYLVADREVQHVVRADRHGAHRAGLEGVGVSGEAGQLVLQFDRARCEAEYFLVFRIQQEHNDIGRRGEEHLREVRLRENVDILMRGVGVKEVDRVDTFGLRFGDAAKRACGEVPIGVEQVQIVSAHCQVDCRVYGVGDLVAEIEIRRVGEGAIFAGKNPHRARGGVEHVQISVIEGERGDAPPIGVWQGGEWNCLRHLPGRAIQ